MAVVGQEVVKAATGKFHPIHQGFYLDALECALSGVAGARHLAQLGRLAHPGEDVDDALDV